MRQTVIDDIRIIDADTHVSEPADLWTSRVSTATWGDLVPHVRRGDDGVDRWWWAGEPYIAMGSSATAGWSEHPPSHPPTLEVADHAAWDPQVRLHRMDEYGIWSQVLYPNIGGFGSGKFLALKDPELRIACVRAYNDFISEFASVDPRRLVPIMALPFWDLEATLAEVERAHAAGHKGILFAGDPDRFGQPYLADPYWEPLWNVSEDLGLTINFHIGNSDEFDVLVPPYDGIPPQTYIAGLGVSMFMANVRHIVQVITSGICHRHPGLNIVSVESGVGWVPFALETLDWQWENFGAYKEHPDWDLKPSEYFHRQVYACFWFENRILRAAIETLGPDNLLYETDFPHPTSMSPGPATSAVAPRQYIDATLGDLPEETLRKLLHDNAARIYHID
jgi:predicted TIM-barrel fold metal-dependent hydrolase